MAEGDTGFDPAPLVGRIAGAAGGDASATHRVALRDLPVALLLRCDEYLEDLVREVTVIRLDERPAHYGELGTALLATVDTLLEAFAPQRDALRRGAEDAAQRGVARFDVDALVPVGVADAADLLVAVLEQVQDLSRRARLLTSPMPDDARAFLDWFMAQLAGQVRGELAPGGRYEGRSVSSPPERQGTTRRTARPTDLRQPRQARRQLAGDLSSARDGRHFVVGRLREWGLAGAAQRAELPCAELLSNALFHAGSAVSVAVLVDDAVVRVEVHDRSTEEPVARRRQRAAETGRGLLLVDSIADRWGSAPSPDGKCVWFELDVRHDR